MTTRITASAADPADWIESAARDQAHRPFLRTPSGRVLSYASLRDQSRRFAAALMQRGVASGDRVAVQVDKSAEAVLLYIACLRIGAVYVPINVANTANEVEYFLRDSQPCVAVIRPADRAMLEPAAAAPPSATSRRSGWRGTARFRNSCGRRMRNPNCREASVRIHRRQSCTHPAPPADRKALS